MALLGCHGGSVNQEPEITPCKAKIGANQSIDGSDDLKSGDSDYYTAEVAASCGRCAKMDCTERLTYEWFFKDKGGDVSIDQDQTDLTKNKTVKITGKKKGNVQLEVLVGLTCENKNPECTGKDVTRVFKNITVKP